MVHAHNASSSSAFDPSPDAALTTDGLSPVAERRLLAVAAALCLLLYGGSHAAFWSAVAALLSLSWGCLLMFGRITLSRPSLRALAAVSALVAVPLVQSLPVSEPVLRLISPERALWFARAREAGAVNASPSLSYLPFHTAMQAALWGFVAFWTWRLHRLFHHGSAHRTWFVRFFFALAVLEAAYGLLQVLVSSLSVLGYTDPASGGIARGTFINRNNYAAFLGLLWPVLLAHTVHLPAAQRLSRRAFTRRDMRRQWMERRAFFGFLTALVLLALFFSASRSGILCSLAAGTLFVFFSRTQAKTAAVAVAGCWIILFAYGLIIGLDQVLIRFDRLEADLPGRFRLWRDTWRIIADHPWTGIGVGTFQEVFRLYQTHLPEARFARHAHSDYLQWIAEVGWPIGLVTLSALWGFWLWQAVTLRRRRTTLAPPQRTLAAGCLAGTAGFLLHAWVDFPMQMAANTLIFAAVAVLGYNCLSSNHKAPRTHHEWT